jgi:drug/metabolite transporter (DMT)-like permease
MNSVMTASTLVCVTFISIGQLLFKKAASALPENPGIMDWLLNGWLLTSLALYAATTVGWVWVLRTVPLHMAYPFMGLAFVIVPTLAWFFLKEPLHWKTVAGGLLIMAGVTLASTR